jgi:hypothetical protein
MSLASGLVETETESEQRDERLRGDNYCSRHMIS